MTLEFKPATDLADEQVGKAQPSDGQFLGWSKGELVIQLDFVDKEFIIEWYTRKSVAGFLVQLNDYYPIRPEMRSSCMFGENQEILEGVVLSDIRSHKLFPDQCSYLELNPEDSEIAFAWADESPSPSITMRATGEHTELLENFMEDTLADASFSAEEVSDLSHTTKERVEKGLSNGGQITDLVDDVRKRL